MLYPTDVPVHRPSVGAMAVTAGSQTPSTTRLYVYRGTGVDQFEPRPAPRPKPKPMPRPRPRRKRRSKPRPQPQPADFAVALDAAERARRMLAEIEKPEPEPEPAPDLVHAVKVRRRGSIAPAPDWKPSTGADLDEWLAELEEEE